MSEKKILYIHHSGLMGGGTLSCFDVTSMLVGEHDLSVAIPSGENAARNYGKKINMPLVTGTPNTCVFRYYSGGPVFWKVIGSFVLTYKNQKRWKEFLKHNHYDVILLNSIVLWPMLKLFKNLGISTGLFIRETMRGKTNSLVNKVIRANISRYASGVAFLSKYDMDSWKLDESCLQCILPDVIKEDEFNGGTLNTSNEYLKKGKDDIALLYVGGMNKLKGAITIVKAMEYCPDNVHLYMLGDPMKEVLNKKPRKKKEVYAAGVYSEINRLGLQERVHVVGFSTDMPFWYGNCDICVIPIEEPHQSRSIYEAGLFDKPVIATRFNNYAEYLIEAESGLMFEKGNVAELAEKIKSLSCNKELRERLGKRNHELALTQHSYSVAKTTVNEWLMGLEKL